jgi:hypothetical protein
MDSQKHWSKSRKYQVIHIYQNKKITSTFQLHPGFGPGVCLLGHSLKFLTPRWQIWKGHLDFICGQNSKISFSPSLKKTALT